MIRTDLSPQDRAVLKRLVERLGDGPIRGAEIGVARGETSAWLLRTFPELHLTMVDAWDVYPEDHPYRLSGDGCANLTADQQSRSWLAAMAATEFAADRRTVIRGDSVAMAEKVGLYLLDFAFIDGDHTLGGVRRDLAAWYPRVRNTGLFAGHDIDHPRDKRGIWGVRRAVEEFEQGHPDRTLKVSANIWWFEPFS